MKLLSKYLTVPRTPVEPLTDEQKEFIEYAAEVGILPWEVAMALEISETRAKYEINKIRNNK